MYTEILDFSRPRISVVAGSVRLACCDWFVRVVLENLTSPTPFSILVRIPAVLSVVETIVSVCTSNASLIFLCNVSLIVIIVDVYKRQISDY